MKPQSWTFSNIQGPKSGVHVMDVLWPFKNKIDNQNSGYGCFKDLSTYPYKDWDAKSRSRTFNIFQCPKYELKGCKWSLDLQNQDRGKKILEPSGVEVQLNIQIKIKIPKSQSESYSIPKNHKSRLKGHEFSLHLQNRDKKSIFWTGVYHRPVTISKSKSICQNLTRNPQHPPKTPN